MSSNLPRILSLFLLGSCLAFNHSMIAQTGIIYNSESALDGYTLFEDASNTYLIDNCGDIVNSWSVTNTDNHSKLLPNGHLIFIKNNQVVEVDWNGELVKITSNPDNEILLEYEVILLPSGNYLCLGRKDFTSNQFTDIGFDFGVVGVPSVVDVVVELDRETGEIIWEWNIADHVIQQRDENLPNYGILSESPELLNMDAISDFDWQSYESFMINGMDYNPTLDQIILSIRKIGEIAIIDHSTTTEEAASHTGGNSGKGGDILYRWGNPQNYGRGDTTDQVLYFQHNPNWITEGEHAGKIICYNNGLNRPDVTFEDRYSSVPIIAPLMDIDGHYILEEGQAYGPVTPTLEYDRIATNTFFYSSYTSGAEYLPNGNIFITEGQSGRLLEINPEGEIVWTYRTPSASYIFRTEKYAADYEAFSGLELISFGPVPNSFSTYECMLVTDSDDIATPEFKLTAQYHPSTHKISMENHFRTGFQFSLSNIQGQVLLSNTTNFSTETLDISHLPSAFYILTIIDSNTQQLASFKIIKQ